MANLVGVRFKRLAKIYDFVSKGIEVKKGDKVVVEVDKGIGFGEVVLSYDEDYKPNHENVLKRVVRVADSVDLERLDHNKKREKDALRFCADLVKKHKLNMKLVNVEYLFDSSKAIFNFTADERVDFRKLVKELASKLHTRIEMCQIGVRDEARIIGALGPCGRELCCASFLSSFKPVTVKMAKEQGLVLNPSKISGVCGRLMCCLAYESYGDAPKKKVKKDCSECACPSKAAASPGNVESRDTKDNKKDRPERQGSKPNKNYKKNKDNRNAKPQDSGSSVDNKNNNRDNRNAKDRNDNVRNNQNNSNDKDSKN